MAYETVLLDTTPPIATVTLNRPASGNALDDRTLEEIEAAMQVLEADLDVKVVILRGAGEHFSVGSVPEELEHSRIFPFLRREPLSAPELVEAGKAWDRRWQYLANFHKPTIAQIHGDCLGFGLYLAMVCDLAIAADDARFGEPMIRLGGLTGFPLWTWFIGTKWTRELLYFGSTFDGCEAEAMRMITRAVPGAQLEMEVQRYAEAIASAPGDGMTLLKESVNGTLEMRGLGESWRFLGDMLALHALGTKGSDSLAERKQARDAAMAQLGF